MTPSVNEFISCEGGGADSRSVSSVSGVGTGGARGAMAPPLFVLYYAHLVGLWLILPYD